MKFTSFDDLYTNLLERYLPSGSEKPINPAWHRGTGWFWCENYWNPIQFDISIKEIFPPSNIINIDNFDYKISWNSWRTDFEHPGTREYLTFEIL